MKAVTVDEEIYLVMSRYQAQAVAAACQITSFDWAKGNPMAQRWADDLKRAADELIVAVFNQKAVNGQKTGGNI